jgi:DNA-binding transcriptional ArsR family regulator
MLASRPKNLYSIGENFTVSRQAISLHIRILEECGLITVQPLGRERICSIQPKKLAEVAEWIEPFRAMWEERLDKLGAVLQEMDHKKKTGRKRRIR